MKPSFAATLPRAARALCSGAVGPRAFPRPALATHATPRYFATSTDAPVAAPEIDFKQFGQDADMRSTLISARVVPDSPSYFTGMPNYVDSLLRLQALLRKHETLPTVKPGQAKRIAWQTLVEYRNTVGEQIKTSKYQKILAILNRLNHIHPDLQTPEIKATFEAHKRAIDPFANKAKPIPIDKFGRAVGAGRRKSSTARAWVVEGNGEVMINGKSLVDAFSRVHDRESAIWALKATERIDKYNVWALCEGGGTTGQAEALTLAVAKALLAHEPLLKPALRRGKPRNLLQGALFCSCAPRFDANYAPSWMYHTRSKSCGEKEARSPQGQKDASLGQTLSAYCMCTVIYLYVRKKQDLTQSRTSGPPLSRPPLRHSSASTLSVTDYEGRRSSAGNKRCQYIFG